jgi:hypothetical protein
MMALQIISFETVDYIRRLLARNDLRKQNNVGCEQAWYIPLALSGQYWDASTRSLSFSPDLQCPHGRTLPTSVAVCADAQPSRFVLPFFFAIPGLEGDSERTAAGHLEVPRCTDSAIESVTSSGRNCGRDGHILRLLAGGPLADVTVVVLDPRTGDRIALQRNLTLLGPGDYALLDDVDPP